MKKIYPLILVLLTLIQPVNGDWSAAVPISDGPASTNNGGTPLLINSNSVATVGYLDGQMGNGNELFSSSLSPQANAWSTPQSIYINNDTGLFPSAPIMFEDAAGNQFAGFGLADPITMRMSLKVCRRPVNSDTWSAPITQQLNGFPNSAGVAPDKLGNLAVLFGLTQNNNPPYTITLANILANSSTWSPQINLGVDNISQNPAVAAAANLGMATLAWKTTPPLQVRTARFDFSNQQILPLPNLTLPDFTTDIEAMIMTADPKGDAILVFGARLNTANGVLYSTTLLAGSNTWSTPLQISNSNNSVIAVSIASDAVGNTTIFWGERTSNNQQFGIVATLPLGGTPTFVTNLTNNFFSNGSSSQVAMDSFGNAAVVYETSSERSQSIQVASKPAGQNWSDPFPLSTTGVSPLIALSDQGTGVAGWVDSNTNVLMGSRNFGLFGVAPPSKFIGKTIQKGSKTYLRLTWNPSPAPNIATYQIFRNRKLIASTPGDGPFEFLEPLPSKRIVGKYFLRAIDSNGNKSALIEMKRAPKHCWEW